MSALRFLIQYGIDDLVLNLLRIIGMVVYHQVSGILWYVLCC